MKKILMVTVLTYFLNINMLQAQVTENFNDGDFIANPAWKGDGTQFTINSGQLQLNSSGSDSSHLVTNYNYLGGNYEWDFWQKQNFSPSSSNYGRIYLSSNQPDLESSLQGYFLQFGESGSNDAVELFRQDGFAISSVGRGINGQIANGFTCRIKVLRDTLGRWIISSNYLGGTILTQEISGTDNNYLPGGWFGFRCNYTSSNATKFYLDDIFIGKEILDTLPPKISGVTVLDSLHIDIHFNEILNSTSANTLTHYQLFPSGGNPLSVVIDSVDPSTIHLTLFNNLIIGITYSLIVNTVVDLSGNISISDSIDFTFIETKEVVPGDIVITEIMANPTDAPSLPNAEYVELYNRSDNYLSTKDWKIYDASTSVILPDDTLAPKSYRAYCTSANLLLFQQIGITNMKGLSSLPSLNNDGDNIGIKDKNGNVLDQLNYNLSYYHNDLKSSGGWSLERVDKNFLCANINNWIASSNSSGGTPGIKNSIEKLFIDNVSPYLIHVTVLDSVTIRLHFSEAVDTTLAKLSTNFNIDKNIGTPQYSYCEYADASVIRLKLQKQLVRSTIYEVTVKKDLRDCAGNPTAKYLSASFGIPDSVTENDVVINEILFNPKPDGSDYVEVYNRSTKVIDLHSLKIANADPITGIIGSIYNISAESRLLIPNQYIVLTENDIAIKNTFYVTDPRTLFDCSLPSYNDDEGVVVLLNSTLKVIDNFHYTDKLHFALLTDVEGVSLERLNPNRKSNENSNWHSASSASGFGTPGNKNSQYFEGSETLSLLTVEPELFSPDNDGSKDNVSFAVKMDKSGYYASVLIFNSEGVKIKSLTSNELLGNNAIWTWNGIDDDNALSPMGIYIVYLEMIHPDGEVLHDKKPFVLAHKI